MSNAPNNVENVSMKWQLIIPDWDVRTPNAYLGSSRWVLKADRERTEKLVWCYAQQQGIPPLFVGRPRVLFIRLFRMPKRAYDDDNLVAAFKKVRDTLVSPKKKHGLLGALEDDRPESAEFLYRQGRNDIPTRIHFLNEFEVEWGRLPLNHDAVAVAIKGEVAPMLET
jgi:hypothetical protein